MSLVPREEADVVSLKVLYLGLAASITTGTHETELALDWVGLGDVYLFNNNKKVAAPVSLSLPPHPIV